MRDLQCLTFLTAASLTMFTLFFAQFTSLDLRLYRGLSFPSAYISTLVILLSILNMADYSCCQRCGAQILYQRRSPQCSSYLKSIKRGEPAFLNCQRHCSNCNSHFAVSRKGAKCRPCRRGGPLPTPSSQDRATSVESTASVDSLTRVLS
ncbi:hypothetical protein BDV34DRAFT_146391 [Aspergillus parasiticus]|uniref:Uncharacterized protein n=1 Tax=Aspergillus parasiticus TaxID=5067 RepID=A0A5N6DEH1_ASPPA|nr:hypothetical protein BDV34DRAFT_146391 [Aspergillus parasiticus]